MVAARYAYSRGRTFMVGVSAVFAVVIGFVALFFAAAPKLWSPGNQSSSADFFTQNTAHADVPSTSCVATGSGDSGSCGCDSGGADSGGCCGL